MIVLTNVSKSYNDKTALRDLSFKTKEGEIIGFLGPNGAGKTTTMRLILGLLVPSSGDITIENIDPKKDRTHIMKKVGYLPENNPLYPDMLVREYLQFIADIKKVSDYRYLLEEVGLTDVIDTKIENLSRVYKQRVGLAAALMGAPSILLLDEPTSGLDPLEQEKIRELIKKISKKKTIIFSTHILSEAEEIASRVIIIDHGCKMYDGEKPQGKGAVEKLFRKVVKSD